MIAPTLQARQVYYDWLPRETLGQRVRKLRGERSMDAVIVAAHAACPLSDLSKSTLSRVEHDKDIAVSNLYQIARGLGVELDALVAGVDFAEYGVLHIT